MSTESISSERNVHLALWIDRLQDAVDGALAPAEASIVQAHISECAICHAEHRQLCAIDAQLRGEFSQAFSPSDSFDRNMFARIDALEAEKRALAKQRELHEFEVRLAQARSGWRQLLRFHLGNILGGAATAVAVISAIAGMWPTLAEDLRAASSASGVLQGNTIAASIAMAAVAATFAAASILILRRLERRGG
jgi:anti-sigma factor RsiW